MATPLAIPKDSPLYTAPPAVINPKSSFDMAGTDYGVGAFTAPTPTASPIVTSSASRTQDKNNAQIIADKTAALANPGAPIAVTPDPNASVGSAAWQAYQNMPNGGITTGKDPNAPTDPQAAFANEKTNPFAPGTQAARTWDTNKAAKDAKAKDTTTSVTDTTSAETDSLKTLATDAFNQWKQGAGSDAALSALIDSIHATFQSAITQMQETNRQMTAIDTATGYGGGAARYAPNINDSNIADTVQKGVMRINTLQAQELQAIVQAKQAKDEKNVAMTNEYVNKMMDLNKQKQDALIQMHSQLNADKNQIIQQSQEARAQATADQKTAQDTAAKYAQSVSDLLDSSPTQAGKKKLMDEFINAHPEIDPQLLQTAVADYSQKKKSQDSVIAARESAATAKEQGLSIQEQRLALAAEKQSTGTIAEKKDNAFAGINQLLSPDNQTKITAKGGIPFIDSEGYITPEGFKTLVASAQEEGISRKDFLDKYASQMYIEKGKASKYGLTAKETADYASANATPDNGGTKIDANFAKSSFPNLDASYVVSKAQAYHSAGLTDTEIIKLLESENNK